MSVEYKGTVCSWRTLGLAATPHNLLSLANASATRWLAIRQIELHKDTVAALATLAPVARVTVPTANPTGGTALTPSRHIETGVAYGSVGMTFLGATASDGGAATAITATAGATPIWQATSLRAHTLVGEVAGKPLQLLPEICETNPLVLANGERLLVQLLNAGTVSDHLLLSAMIEVWTTATG